MAFTDRFTGEGLVIKVTPTGGSLITISDDYSSFGYNRQFDNEDVTAGNSEDREFLKTKKGMTFSLDIFGGDDDTWNAVFEARTGVMEVYRHGVGTGEEYFSFNYVLDGADASLGTDKSEEITLTGTKSGAMVADFGSVQGGVPHLTFSTAPVNTASDEIIGGTAGVVVSVLDAANAVMTNDNSTLVTIAIASGTGALDGIKVVRVVAGVARFGNLSITETGAFTLTATASGNGTITPVTSSSITIS